MKLKSLNISREVSKSGAGKQESKRIMVTIVWISLGFHGIGMISKAQLLNASYSIKHLLQPILEFHPESRESHRQGIFNGSEDTSSELAKEATHCVSNHLRWTMPGPASLRWTNHRLLKLFEMENHASSPNP
jgi:hypothetical protein